MHYARRVGIPSGRSPLPPGLGIITLRTGAGRYAFSIRSFLMLDSHSSSPFASIFSNVTPSTPGAPLFARISSYACRRMSSRWILQVEAEVRLRLRLEIQLPLKVPDLIGCLQAHRQSPILLSVKSTPEVRALSSAGVTQLHRSYDPVRLPCRPAPESAVEAATLA